MGVVLHSLQCSKTFLKGMDMRGYLVLEGVCKAPLSTNLNGRQKGGAQQAALYLLSGLDGFLIDTAADTLFLATT